MTNSKLISYTDLSPHHSGARTHQIDKITIHHMAGNFTVEECGKGFHSRRASANYGIGTDGRIALYVDESNRAWTSSSRENDQRAVTIEVANSSVAPDWKVSDQAMASLIDLCVDICRRNGIEKLNFTGDKNGNLTMHKYFAATTCPGPYLEGKFPTIAEEVNRRLNQSTIKKGDFTLELRTLKKGCKGEDVRALQILLIGNGFSCGSKGADGDFGSNTDKALRAYQSAKKLAVDGKAGPATMGSLLGT